MIKQQSQYPAPGLCQGQNPGPHAPLLRAAGAAQQRVAHRLVKRLSIHLFIVLSVITMMSGTVQAQTSGPLDADPKLATEPGAGTKLIVGTKVAAPFAMRGKEEQWYGISIDLMQQIATRLGVAIEFREHKLGDLISKVESGELDASIAAISITPEREQRIDFSHQYFGSGLAIVTPESYQPGWKSMFKALVSPQFLATIFLLCCVLSFVGIIIWVLETRRNSGQFGKSPAQGIGSGFWFAAVTMTTVGYGDKAPITLAGRIVSVIWMFAALILTAFLTAQLTTILTAQSAENVVTNITDLPHARVGNLVNASSQRYFDEQNIQVTQFESISEGFDAIANNKIDAFVHDRPLLAYRVNQSEHDLLILPELFDPQSYAIAVGQQSPLRELINVELLEILNSDEWLETKKQYLGTRH
jgi:ABC-type amino acid transport substrate-binding protein